MISDDCHVTYHIVYQCSPHHPLDAVLVLASRPVIHHMYTGAPASLITSDARHLCHTPSNSYQGHARFAQACVTAYVEAVMLVVVVLCGCVVVQCLCCEEGCTSKACVYGHGHADFPLCKHS